MAQNEGAPNGAQQAGPAEHNPPHRIVLETAAEESLPGHLQESITKVPVTPGITSEAYDSEGDKTETTGLPGGYFSRHEADHAIAASPLPGTTNVEGQSFQSKIDTGAQEGTNFMRRLSVAVMGDHSASRESMSEIRAISPDLALTGNIISATFNIPHTLRYRKGADWVRFSCFLFLVAIFPDFGSASAAKCTPWLAASANRT